MLKIRRRPTKLSVPLFPGGAEAIYAGGDNTVLAGLDSIVAVTRKNEIPVFSNTPIDVKRGVLLAVGANYYDVGKITGKLAVKILNGISPTTLPIKNVVPESLAFNTEVLSGLGHYWKIPEALLSKADLVVTSDGIEEKKSP